MLKQIIKKEAIDIVFNKHFKWQNPEAKERGYSPFLKKDFEAEELEKLFAESLDKVIDLELAYKIRNKYDELIGLKNNKKNYKERQRIIEEIDNYKSN